MGRQFFVKCVCKFGLSATNTFAIIEQVKKVSVNNEKVWVLDLVEPRHLIKVMDIDHNWVIEKICDENLEF